MYNFTDYGYTIELCPKYAEFSADYVLSESQKLAARADAEITNDLAHPGVYGIFIGSRLVYIGQSKDMLVRFFSHSISTNFARNNKYAVLREAIGRNLPVTFSPMYISPKVEKNSLKADLDRVEGELIRAFVPPLNVLIPLGGDDQVENCDSYSVSLSDIQIF